MKNTLKTITFIFIGLLIALTFFSQTITDLRVARVTLAFRETRTVIPEVHSTGTVSPLNTRMLFAPVDGIIVQIQEPGYQGLSASVLFSIHTDVQSLQDLLTLALDEQRLIALNIERVQNDRNLETQRINQTTIRGLEEYDIQLVTHSHQLEQARRNLEEQENLVNQGLAPRQSLADKENAISALELSRDQIIARRDLAQAEQERTQAAQLRTHQAAISQLDLQLRIHAMEAERVQQRINELNTQIEEGGIIEVRADGNLTVLEVMPGLMVGARINEGSPVMTSAYRDGMFRVLAAFGQNIPYITRLEERMPAYIHYGAMEIIGRIARVYPDGDRIMVAIDVETTRFIGGELAMVRIQGPGVHSRQALPRSALRTDRNGHYILYVEAVERLFGYSYYARIQRIHSVSAWGIDGFVATEMNWGENMIDSPVIINSDAPVHAGDRIRPVEVGEFFDTR